MNCLLHDIEGNLDHGGAIRLGNTLGSDGENLPKAHIVATNPPFGSAAGTDIVRTFVHPTSNKQLCFIQACSRNAASRRSCSGGGAG